MRPPSAISGSSACADAGVVDQAVEFGPLAEAGGHDLADPGGEGRDRTRVGHVEPEGEGGAPEGSDLGAGVRGVLLVVAVGDDDVEAAAGEVQCGVAAEAAAAAGDQDDAGCAAHAGSWSEGVSPGV